ncbi:MAG: bifunctional glutamate N-acetyltransferase/amino-acid acetyltransferase ArgJ [Rhodobacteraceae bacterium]|nr:bifunctional glutamate N-acetyltransferase/amino-acid acetyltransferase ArgJ [Paracoccaceae bacterium]
MAKGKDKKAKKDKAAKKGKKARGAAKAHPVSPLAPKGGFPSLPAISGAEFAAVAAGVRYAGRLDVMVARLAPGTAIAGAFTRSATRSAPVRACEARLAMKPDPKAGAAIVVNSGNSNAFTGAAGETSVAAVTDAVAKALDVPAARVFPASTGVIGQPLPHERIVAVTGDLAAGLAEGNIELAARAIMTTDTFPKGATATVEIDGAPVTIAGIAKGSGMIAPDMATMLVYLFTDAKVGPVPLQRMLSRAVDETFNCITVDGDTSTSDTLILAATGKSKAPEIRDVRTRQGRDFYAALCRVMMDLAHQVVRDGEGATKFVEVAVTGAKDAGDAKKVAFAIANSPLVKTAVAGQDPNWGRIVMAVGKSGAEADRDRLTIRLGEVLVAEKGMVAPGYREADGAAHMKGEEIRIGVDLGLGKGAATVWTCDLTDRYVEINADYRS